MAIGPVSMECGEYPGTRLWGTPTFPLPQTGPRLDQGLDQGISSCEQTDTCENITFPHHSDVDVSKNHFNNNSVQI